MGEKSAVAGAAGAVAAQSGPNEAGATVADPTSGGSTVVVDEVHVLDGGFVTVHDSSLTEGDTAFAMAHRDTDSNGRTTSLAVTAAKTARTPQLARQ
ncbi:DUF7282 domain-containing protein [Halorubrum sp. FL23]|uniref:DUF7282 domain-containing protein n=1 Tax=Halorubrum sp. FL23 TaxID=3458704 RepID=UPI004033167A